MNFFSFVKEEEWQVCEARVPFNQVPTDRTALTHQQILQLRSRMLLLSQPRFLYDK